MPLLNETLQLHDVNDVEFFCSQIVQHSGLALSYHEREDLTTYLVGVCWELSERYNPAGSPDPGP